MKKIKTSALKRNAKLLVASVVALESSAFAAAVDANSTILGKMVNSAATDLWGTVGVTLVSGLLIAGGAWEAKKTNDLKPLGYGIGMAIAAAGAFAIGPNLYTYVSSSF